MPAFRPAYLIHGDDHGRVAERRARLRAMAEAESGAGGTEILEGDACTPDAVAAALSAMTFALGRRFVIADGVERWKDKDVAPVAAAMEGIEAAELTVAFFGREEGRAKVPQALHEVVTRAGGQIAEESTVKPWELPKWTLARAKELGLELDSPGAKALVAHVGDRQQRLLRELEKLALEYGSGAAIGIEEVEASSASSAERKAWTLGDAVVAGDPQAAVRILLELRAQGEAVGRLVWTLQRPLRQALAVAEQLAAGQSPAQVKKGLRMAPRAADRLVKDVQRRDAAAYRRALAALGDLEVELRGGAGASAAEDTAGVRAVLTAATG
ncbi:MAG TPA: DNA polymerase III subunit delta [Solirubrobacteraceae bacterium]|nr:DNA polymerase III subunit delta [Solirubrobacteraceae bacterium]